METVDETAPVSKKMLWVSHIISTVPVMLLLFSATGKFLKPDGMEANIEGLGWKMSQMTGLGILELACVVLYLIPQTAVLGAVLLTAYLGGATATHVRIGDPFFIPIIAGVMIWLGLYLRDGRIRELLPLAVSMEVFMSKYVDVYLLPIPEKNIEAYRKMAESAGKLFRKHGALTYREYVASDLKVPEEIMSFPVALKLEAGETLVYAAVTFESEEHRNESMAKIYADPEMGGECMEEMTGDNPIFDLKRMAYGGFSILVDL